MSTPPVSQQADQQQYSTGMRFFIFSAIVAGLVLMIVVILSLDSGNSMASIYTGGSSVLVLALPAFLAGMLSFLSPCTLPILPAYFAFTFQASKQSIVLMTVAFFLGLATTMTLLGASATALAGLIFDNKSALTFWGGMIVIGFGIMSVIGKGFAGFTVQERPAATILGSYLYGATFALGWTVCVGPILGGLLMLLASSQGVAILQGAVLAFIYAMGLGMPLILMASFFSRLGTDSRFWRIVRGRGFELQIANRTLYVHTTSIASGLLLIVMGLLLSTGQLTRITDLAQRSSFAQWWMTLESGIGRLFGL